jgi:predicted unusual protein kinase regulating ubiquinone biosynthesis (AarF/ABC1/UbiB family)
LEIYFLQLFCSKDTLLDLRKERFTLLQSGTIVWKANGLSYQFSETFLEGIKELYSGFYESNDMHLENGLIKLGLVNDSMSKETRQVLINLLESHFGQGKTNPMKFEISQFMSSFDNLFLFLKKYKLTLSEDFLFLGINLLTLYMHLESLGQKFDVSAAYKNAIGQAV